MAYCAKCGHELQPGDQFCAKCGTPVGVAPTTQTVQWEYCEIQFKTETGFLRGYKSHFAAEAIGPNGVRQVARSAECDPDVERDISGARWIPSNQCYKLLEDFVQALVRLGWEPLSEKGPKPWNYKFRRRAGSASSIAIDSAPKVHPGAARLPATYAEFFIRQNQALVRQGPGAALSLIDDYLAATPEESKEHIEGMFDKAHLLGREMRDRQSALAVYEALLDIILRMLEKDPRNVRLWNYKIRWFKETNVRDMQSAAERQLQMIKKGLPATAHEYIDAKGELGTNIFGDEALALATKVIRANPPDVVLLVIAMLDRAALLRLRDRSAREVKNLALKARALCERELAKDPIRDGATKSVTQEHLRTSLERAEEFIEKPNLRR